VLQLRSRKNHGEGGWFRKSDRFERLSQRAPEEPSDGVFQNEVTSLYVPIPHTYGGRGCIGQQRRMFQTTERI